MTSTSVSSSAITTPTTPNRIEWPTVALACAIYGWWLLATFFHAQIPPVFLAVIGGWLIAWQGSLQHEAIHGHPSPWRALNTAIAAPALSLWLPYEAYRRSHVAHHAAEHLTHPHFDPEARYLPAGRGWPHVVARAAARVQSTLIGRLLVGPFGEVISFIASEAQRVWRRETGARRTWALHVVNVAAILSWVHFACHMRLGAYLLFFVYPGLALSLVRSFAEHRADPTPERRVAVVEKAPLLGLLFLNNNLHAAHHAWPGLAWWLLPARYREHREALLAANGGLVYAGYGEVFARFLLRPHDRVVHPGFAAPQEPAR